MRCVFEQLANQDLRISDVDGNGAPTFNNIGHIMFEQ